MKLFSRKVQGSAYLFWVSEVVYELDFLYKVPSNVPDLLAQIVLSEGVVCRQPEAHIFVAGWVPAVGGRMAVCFGQDG